MRCFALGPCAVLLGLLLAAPPALAAARTDPGILLRLDRARFDIVVRDLRSGTSGPKLRVAIGSPAHPTPSGVFHMHRVILNPAWIPGPHARAAGATPMGASIDGPLGVAKIPFTVVDGSAFELHGGGDPILLGKPISSGCVRAGNGELLELLGWLSDRGVLGPARRLPDGEIRQNFRRPVRFVVR